MRFKSKSKPKWSLSRSANRCAQVGRRLGVRAALARDNGASGGRRLGDEARPVVLRHGGQPASFHGRYQSPEVRRCVLPEPETSPAVGAAAEAFVHDVRCGLVVRVVLPARVASGARGGQPRWSEFRGFVSELVDFETLSGDDGMVLPVFLLLFRS